MKAGGVTKKRVFITVPDKTVALYGLETIWRDDVIVGYLRRGEYAYYLDTNMGIGYGIFNLLEDSLHLCRFLIFSGS